MSCPACFQGVTRTDKTPCGKIKQVHGFETYVAEPPDGKAAAGIIVIVPDAFGLPFVNNQLLADEYALQGNFRVYLPDIMNGRCAKIEVTTHLDSVQETSGLTTWLTKPYHFCLAIYGFGPFLYQNRLAITMPRVEAFLSALKRSVDGKLPVGVAGFCWGGQHVMRLAKQSPDEALVDAVFTAHPSGLFVPGDFETVRLPVAIAVGDKDNFLTPENTRKIEGLLQKNGVVHEVKLYEGAGHGFSVRIDRKNAKQAEQATEAEAQAVAWFKKCFAMRQK